MIFQCDKCGQCCKHLLFFGEMYKLLDRGDGVCRYLDYDSNLCSVYEYRPLICRIDEGYRYYSSSLTYREYIEITKNACKILKTFNNKVDHK